MLSKLAAFIFFNNFLGNLFVCLCVSCFGLVSNLFLLGSLKFGPKLIKVASQHHRLILKVGATHQDSLGKLLGLSGSLLPGGVGVQATPWPGATLAPPREERVLPHMLAPLQCQHFNCQRQCQRASLDLNTRKVSQYFCTGGEPQRRVLKKMIMNNGFES